MIFALTWERRIDRIHYFFVEISSFHFVEFILANDFKGDANPGKCLKPFTIFSTHDDNDDDDDDDFFISFGGSFDKTTTIASNEWTVW